MAELMAASDLNPERKERRTSSGQVRRWWYRLGTISLIISKMEAGGLQVGEVAFD
jgi:hypothetical protein